MAKGDKGEAKTGEERDPKMKTTKKKRLLKCHLNDPHLSKFLDANSIGGMSYIFKAGNTKLNRLLWTVFFIGALAGCLVMITLSAIRFSNKPTATTITVVSLDEEGTPFPGVTICNLNLERNFSDTLSNRTYQIMNYLFNPDESFELSGLNTTRIIQLCNGIVPSSSLSIQNTTIWRSQKPAQTIENLIHYCGFIEGVNSPLEDCKSFFRPVLTPAGICYTLNGSNHIMKNSGVRYGLKLVLDINQDTRPSFNGKSGVKMVIHDGQDIARPNLYGINVPPGRGIDVGVRRRVSRDETEENNCIDGRYLPFYEDYRYSQFACRHDATVAHTAQDSVCGCVLQPSRPSTGPFTNTPNCTVKNACCLLENFATFDPKNYCPLPCFYSYYDFTTSYADFPNGHYLDNLMANTGMAEDEIKRNFLSINVYFDDLQVTTTITQYTFGVEGLLGEIGGQMGLFLGIGITTFLEIFVLSLDEIQRLCCTRKMKKKLHEIEEKIPLPEIREEEEEKEEGDDGEKTKLTKGDEEESKETEV